jgi:hypothetical protein
MHAVLPWLSWFLGGSADLGALDANKEHARQALFAGMAFAVHGTKIEELIAEGVAKFLLGKDVLQSESEFTKTGRFGPGALVLIVSGKFKIGEEAAAAPCALFEASLKLLGEYAAQCVELILFHCVAGIHACLCLDGSSNALDPIE